MTNGPLRDANVSAQGKTLAFFRYPFLLCIVHCVIFSAAVAVAQPQRFEFESVQMGVPVRIILYTENPKTAQKAVDAAFETFHRLNSIMSDYDSDSELSLLCKKNDERNDQTGSLTVSQDLFSVLKSAKHFSTLSDGAFDITVGPYTKMWRRSRRMKELPKPVYLEKAKELVGNALWELDEPTQCVRLNRPGMKIDLGGVAKGYAIDRAFECIQKFGIESLLVDAGGDMRLGKSPAFSRQACRADGWTIQLAGDTIIYGLENTALASSGDTTQFVEINGVKYSHLIDPKTGLGLTTPCIVHVAAPTAADADALASALSVMEPEKGIALAETQKGVAAKTILYENQKTFETKNWTKMMNH